MTRDLMIGELKKIKPSYNYDRYDDRQIFRMYQRYVVDKTPRGDVVTQQPSSEPDITPTEKSIEDYAQEYDDQMGYKTCDNCGTRLNDMGTCPKCDDGEEDLLESYDMTPEVRNHYNKLKGKAIKGDILVYLAMMDHNEAFIDSDTYDWNSEEGIQDIIMDLKNTVEDLDEDEFEMYLNWWNKDSLTEGIRIDNDNEPFNIGSRVAERWDDGEFNVGSIINIKKDETGTQYLVQWDYSDLNNMQWLYGDELTHWLDDIEENFTIDDEYTNSTTEDKICVICGATIERYGNNADPIADGICCDKCNREKVIPARIKMLLNNN